MRVRFWGVRGSYPVPGPKTNRYGGNTACVQILPDSGTVLIIDAGTGIRRLGKELAAGALRHDDHPCHLLISHTHWDHIQGLPFFAPLYLAGSRVNIYARQRDVHLRTIFCSQTEDPYFPVSLDEVAAQVTYTALIEGTSFEVEDVQVRCARLNHPHVALGYRLDVDGASVAYVSDTAPFDSVLLEDEFISKRPDIDNLPPEPDAAKLAAMRSAVVDLCRGCDLVIYDTMFRMREYLARPHWGHSSPEHAIEVVEEAGAGCLVLFHHSPERSDDELDHDLELARSRARTRVLAAAEGTELSVRRGVVEERR
jgi:phosphoribosyl 1,2-cyclic phosphodiesterase